MQEISATYSPEDNKLRLYPAMRLDPETYARVKAAGYIWAPRQELFVAPMWTPLREDLALELAGEIGDEDTSLVERAENRASRFDKYAEHRQADAERAERSITSIAEGIPFGQPILVGHHSQRRAERDAEKIQRGTEQAAKMWQTSAYWLNRAEGAISHAMYKLKPWVRIRRIKTLEAEKRRFLRAIAEGEKKTAIWNSEKTITLEAALAIASSASLYITDADGKSVNLWSALGSGTIEPEEARRRVLSAIANSRAYANRWVAHIENRLCYERAMLKAEGVEEPAPIKKSASSTLPLINYRADSVTYISFGKSITTPQIEMTKAEYAKVCLEKKCTRVVNGTHRIRVMIRNHEYVAVFLTDAKAHNRPEVSA